MDGLFGKDKKGKGREGDERTTRSEYNAIAWVNDMGRGRFGEASGRLLGEVKGTGEVGVRHVSSLYVSLLGFGLFYSITYLHSSFWVRVSYGCADHFWT
jgi:hypothetical protein